MTETLDKVSAAWEKTEDKPAVATLGVFALVGLVALAGVLKAVDSLPLVPTLLELVGIAYTAVRKPHFAPLPSTTVVPRDTVS